MRYQASRHALATFFALALLYSPAWSQTVEVALELTGPKASCDNVPVRAMIELPNAFAAVPQEQITVTVRPYGVTGDPLPGQIVKQNGSAAELWWIVPRLRIGEGGKWTATLSVEAPSPGNSFHWKEHAEGELDLVFGDRRVLRYMHAYDASSEERLHETYKVYHHVFDAAGRKLLTKGSGGLYTHHRGIFIGWNKLKTGDDEYDFWHMKGVTQRHQRFFEQIAGPVLARSRMLIHWVDPNDKTVIVEEREITVFRQPAPTVLLLDFRTKLKAVAGDIFLNGDPEHAGMQYRPHNDVADGGPDIQAKYVFHKDGIDALKDEDLPWAAMSYGLNGKRYSVQHMNHPDNPAPSKYSAYRDYGRFGNFFTKKLKAGETLSLRYRIQVIEGNLPERDRLAARHAAFIDVPQAKVLAIKP